MSHHAVKQCKRKFKKLGKTKNLIFHKYIDNKTLHVFLKDFTKKHPSEPIGFINEDAKIMQNITLLPDIPNLETKTFQTTENENIPNVFCLHSNVTKIHYNSTIHNQYWNHIDCDLSLNFVLTTSFLPTFLKSINTELSFESTRLLFTYFATLFTKTASVTQYNFTHDSNLYVTLSNAYYAKVCHNKQKLLDTYQRQLFEKNSGFQLPLVNTDIITNTMNSLEPDTAYKYTPKISVVMTLTDINQFFVTFHSFLKQDYPRDKLELYILDEFKLDTKIKHLIPPESRIRFINMQTKENKKVPLGYKLNTGFKYASSDIVCVMLDTHYYSPDYIKNHVYQLLESKRECNVSNLHLYKNKGNYKIHTQTSLDIGSLAATKKLWNNYSFQELENSPQALLFDFIRYRQPLVNKSPFKCFSFLPSDNHFDTHPTQLEINPTAQESIDVYNQCKISLDYHDD
jgi:hypothetical protein